METITIGSRKYRITGTVFEGRIVTAEYFNERWGTWRQVISINSLEGLTYLYYQRLGNCSPYRVHASKEYYERMSNRD